MKGSSAYHDTTIDRKRDYLEFWNRIKASEHICIEYLQVALENYFKNKSNMVNDLPDSQYREAERVLIEKIEQRYHELRKIIHQIEMSCICILH